MKFHMSYNINNPSSHDRLLGLEVIRFISAISILLWHYQDFSIVAYVQKSFVVQKQPLFWLLRFFYHHGEYAVQVFWCISGFIFFWKYRESISNKLIDGKKFLILRFSRLYPLHIATLLFVALLQLVYFHVNGYYFAFQNNKLLNFFLQLFMASAWFPNQDSFNGPIWSISVEVLVYFIFFLILRYFSKSVSVNILIIIICVIAKIARISSPILDCLLFFYIGGLSAIVKQSSFTRKRRVVFNSLSLGIACCILIISWALKLNESQEFIFPFLIIFTPILLFCASENINIKPPLQKFIETAGNLTYSSYLIHFPIILSISLIYSIAKTPIPFYNPLFFAIFIVITLVTSFFIFRYFETPTQNLIRIKFK